MVGIKHASEDKYLQPLQVISGNLVKLYSSPILSKRVQNNPSQSFLALESVRWAYTILTRIISILILSFSTVDIGQHVWDVLT